MSNLKNHEKNWAMANEKINAKRKTVARAKPSPAAKVSSGNKAAKAKVAKPITPIRTFEGAPAFNPELMTELFLLTVNSMWNGDTFYESDDKRLGRFHQLCQACSQDEKGRLFLASLAVYTREQMDLRSTPSMLTSELFLNYNPWSKEAANKVWLRGDEHLESMAYCKLVNSKYPKALLKSVANRLNNMSPISFVKYKGDKRTVTQRDALIVSHPTPKDDFHNVAFKWLIHGTSSLTPKEKAIADKLVDNTATWERSLSEGGATKENWEELLKAGKLGYMAMLRNLRNIAQAKVSEKHLKYVCNTIMDPEEVRRSRLLPFRFYSAYNALCIPNNIPSYSYYSSGPKLLVKDPNIPIEIYTAVERAMDISVENMQLSPGKTLVLVDVSGSMTDPVSNESKITRMEAAFPIAAALLKKGAELYSFNTHAKKVEVCADSSILAIIQHIIRSGVNGGTAIGNALVEVLRDVNKGLKRYDRIVILTDEQSADNSDAVIKQYLSVYPTSKVYVINLAGHKALAFDPNLKNLIRLGGFSDKVIDMINSMENNNIPNHVILTAGLVKNTTDR